MHTNFIRAFLAFVFLWRLFLNPRLSVTISPSCAFFYLIASRKCPRICFVSFFAYSFLNRIRDNPRPNLFLAPFVPFGS